MTKTITATFLFDDTPPLDEHAIEKQLEYLLDDIRRQIELHMEQKAKAAVAE